jgi:hypothetical protein
MSLHDTQTGPVREKQIADFLASHGGPFYELQARLRLLSADALKVRSRAVVFVAVAWAVPFVLGLPTSLSLREGSFLTDLGVWARFFVAIAAFVLAEEQVERRLRVKLAQFLRAPLLAPESTAPAAAAVVLALKERDSRLAETIILVLAGGAALFSFFTLKSGDASSWASVHTVDGNMLTASGWWSVCISLPLCIFLLLRGLWRHFVWARLLRKIATLELRLVATHPDGKGGLGFLADYPNAYMLFVFGMSSVIAAALTKHHMQAPISISTFGIVMGSWLAIVIALFAYPLAAFSPPLARLKESALLWLGAEATRYHRAAERKLLGRNIVANAEGEADEDLSDPTKVFETTRKLSSVLLSRSAIIPVAAAALVPFSIAGAAWLPYKDILSVLKKLLLV